MTLSARNAALIATRGTPVRIEVFCEGRSVGAFTFKPHGARDGHGAHDAAFGIARLCMRNGSPVSLVTTLRTMTPLGPVNRKVVARY